jgi:hypothetical protein
MGRTVVGQQTPMCNVERVLDVRSRSLDTCRVMSLLVVNNNK